jgi:hypothetical protein
MHTQTQYQRANGSVSDDSSSLGDCEHLFKEVDVMSFPNDEDDDCIHYPQPDDVLLGRGKSNQSHPGNVRFQGRLLSNNRTPQAFVGNRFDSQRSFTLFAHKFWLFPSIALININRERYFSAKTNLEKKAITEEILSAMETVGRFLKKARRKPGCWVQVTGEPVRVKVAQALQYRQRRTTTTCAHSPIEGRRSKESSPVRSFPLEQEESRPYRRGHRRGSNSAPDYLSTFEPLPAALLSPHRQFIAAANADTAYSNENLRRTYCNQEHRASFEPLHGQQERPLVLDDDLLWVLGMPRRSAVPPQVRNMEETHNEFSIGMAAPREYDTDRAKTTLGAQVQGVYQNVPPRTRLDQMPPYQAHEVGYQTAPVYNNSHHFQEPQQCEPLHRECGPAPAPPPEIDIFSALERAGFLDI